MQAHSTAILTHDIQHSYEGRTVLRGVSITVPPGQRIGLLGENGAGKSTLLRIIAGEEEPDAGAVSRPARTGLLWQEVRFSPGETVDSLLEAALAEPRAVAAELEAAASALAAVGPEATTDAPALAGAEPQATPAEAASRYDRALAAAERAEVWSLEARRDEVLAGLGLTSIPLDRRLDAVSGGQRTRFALAALLLRRPEALLLDEPSNHLDDEAAAYLERQLAAWPGPVLFASHDRAFLDAVATHLLDLDALRDAPVTAFGGNYSDWLVAKAAERERWEAQFALEQDELKALEHAVAVTARTIQNDRGRQDNDKMQFDFKTGKIQKQLSRRVRNADRRREELERTQLRKPPALLRFQGIPHGSAALADASGPLVQLREAEVPDRLVLPQLDIGAEDRLLVTGANGAGKSTLLAVLAGELALPRGTVQRRKGLRIGLLRQDIRFVEPHRSPRALYEAAVGESRAEQQPLAGFGLVAPRDLERPVGALSIGQQRRVALALVIAKPPHLFLLDEPTNHLSLALAEELEAALGSYPGAVVIASHDRWLRRRWTGRVLGLEAAA